MRSRQRQATKRYSAFELSVAENGVIKMPIQTQHDVATAVSAIERQYQQVPGLILTEFDAQCLLFGELRNMLEQRGQAQINTDRDGVLASPIHGEIKILDSSRKLLLRPDIIVMNDRSMSLVREDEEQLSARKGFVFYGSALYVEVKFCKKSVGIDAKFSREVESDCQKLENIHARLYPENENAEMAGCVVVINKTNIKCVEFEQLIEEKRTSQIAKIIYATGRHADIPA